MLGECIIALRGVQQCALGVHQCARGARSLIGSGAVFKKALELLKAPARYTVPGGLFCRMRAANYFAHVELISTSYEGGTLIIIFFLRTAKGSCSQLITGLSSSSAPS